MDLKQVHQAVHRRRGRKRVARGPSSGHGKTATRGFKGQKSRAGAEKPHRLFEGGQMKTARRIPKRGFHNRWAKRYAVVNVQDLDEMFGDGDTIDPDVLERSGLVKGPSDGVKILGNGDLTKKLAVRAHKFSQSALAKITAAGGSVETLSG